jgi:predicted small lipoprotein YifL
MKPRILAVALLSIGLAACGNKGPLVLPTAPSPEQAPPVESPDPATPTPETLNDQQSETPPQGDASEAGDAATPPGSTPPPTP